MEALGTLSGGVAHDLNNVLGVLVGYSELLLMKMREGTPLEKSCLLHPTSQSEGCCDHSGSFDPGQKGRFGLRGGQSERA